MGYAALITCLQRIESASVTYRNGPPSQESHGALKQSLIDGYLIIAQEERGDPVIDGMRSQILRVCRSIVHALDFGVMERFPDAPSRRMAKDFCTELCRLVRRLMPYLQAMEAERSRTEVAREAIIGKRDGMQPAVAPLR
jgi:hypothetical protein